MDRLIFWITDSLFHILYFLSAISVYVLYIGIFKSRKAGASVLITNSIITLILLTGLWGIGYYVVILDSEPRIKIAAPRPPEPTCTFTVTDEFIGNTRLLK